MPSNRQLHPTFPAFQRWAIKKLVDIVARDDQNVVVYIVGNWLDEHRDTLKEWGITMEVWRQEQEHESNVPDES